MSSVSIAQIIRRRRNRRQRQREHRHRQQVWWIVGLVVAILLVTGPVGVVLGGVASTYVSALNRLPDPQDTITAAPLLGPSQIYDASGSTLLFTADDPTGGQREWVPLDELPSYLVAATLLMEDPDFSQTVGFDGLRTLSTLWENRLAGPLTADTSLTGRLVRNVIAPATLETGGRIDARALEIALIAEIERRYSADEIIEWHLNTNYYGGQAYGIDAAARQYLGKAARELTLDEASMLAAIPTAPQYNPVDDLTAARQRQSDVLRRLLGDGYITQNQFESAANVLTFVLSNAGQAPSIAPEFAIYARRQAEDILGPDGVEQVARGGLRIITTLDLDLYYQSECALRTHLSRLNGTPVNSPQTLNGQPCLADQFIPANAPTLNGEFDASSPPDSGIVIIMDPRTGEIRSMVGAGTRATMQPGPVLYPFVYLDAFTNIGNNSGQLYTPATMLLDIPREFPGAQAGLLHLPQNPDGQFMGPMNLRDAMAMGRVPAVTEVANVRGMNNVLRNIVHRIGFNTLTEGVYNLTLLERGGSVAPLDAAYAYSVLAAGGRMNGLVNPQDVPGLRDHDPVAVRRIEDAEGNLIWAYDEEYRSVSSVPFMENELAYLVNDVLSDPAPRRTLYGDESLFEFARPTAVVNGVTRDRVDNWTVGYTVDSVTVVHLSRTGSAMRLSDYGVEGAATLWRTLYDYIEARDRPPLSGWQQPSNIIELPVCEWSGMLPNGACPTRDEIFITNFQPMQTDTFWETVEVNSLTGQRATASTDAAQRREADYFIPPPAAQDWWVANNLPLPPEEFDTGSVPDILSSAVITDPQPLAWVRGLVTIFGGMDTLDMDYYQVNYGEGLNPATWINLTGQQEQFTSGVPLATWDTIGLDGLYNLQLVVVRQNGLLESSDPVSVRVDNAAPTAELFAGQPGQVFVWNVDEAIPLRVIARDNAVVDRVVFYHNGQEYGVRDDCGQNADDCGVNWPINRPGIETFSVEVYDAAGNMGSAQLQVEILRNTG